MVVLLVTFAFSSLRTRVWWSEGKVWRHLASNATAHWLDLDKVSRKLASKHLVGSKLKPRFKIFSVLLKKKGFLYGLLQAENIRSARCSRVLPSKLLAARKANFFISARARKKKRSARHARECSQRPFVTPKMYQHRGRWLSLWR